MVNANFEWRNKRTDNIEAGVEEFYNANQGSGKTNNKTKLCHSVQCFMQYNLVPMARC